MANNYGISFCEYGSKMRIRMLKEKAIRLKAKSEWKYLHHLFALTETSYKGKDYVTFEGVLNKEESDCFRRLVKSLSSK